MADGTHGDRMRKTRLSAKEKQAVTHAVRLERHPAWGAGSEGYSHQLYVVLPNLVGKRISTRERIKTEVSEVIQQRLRQSGLTVERTANTKHKDADMLDFLLVKYDGTAEHGQTVRDAVRSLNQWLEETRSAALSR